MRSSSYLDTLDVYVFKDFNGISIEVLMDRLSKLPSSWSGNVKRLRYEKDQKTAIIARLLLAYALINSDYKISIDSLPDYSFGEFRKPKFDKESLSFNYSHCKAASICAISKKNVGADIEGLDIDIETLSLAVKSVATSEEWEALNDENGSKVDFLRLWTAKEAYGKWLGAGLRYDYKNKSFRDVLKKDCNKNLRIIKLKDEKKLYSVYNKGIVFSIYGEGSLNIEELSWDELIKKI